MKTAIKLVAALGCTMLFVFSFFAVFAPVAYAGTMPDCIILKQEDNYFKRTDARGTTYGELDLTSDRRSYVSKCKSDATYTLRVGSAGNASKRRDVSVIIRPGQTHKWSCIYDTNPFAEVRGSFIYCAALNPLGSQPAFATEYNRGQYLGLDPVGTDLGRDDCTYTYNGYANKDRTTFQYCIYYLRNMGKNAKWEGKWGKWFIRFRGYAPNGYIAPDEIVEISLDNINYRVLRKNNDKAYPWLWSGDIDKPIWPPSWYKSE